jgi:hypothetical protein
MAFVDGHRQKRNIWSGTEMYWSLQGGGGVRAHNSPYAQAASILTLIIRVNHISLLYVETLPVILVLQKNMVSCVAQEVAS